MLYKRLACKVTVCDLSSSLAARILILSKVLVSLVAEVHPLTPSRLSGTLRLFFRAWLDTHYREDDSIPLAYVYNNPELDFWRLGQ